MSTDAAPNENASPKPAPPEKRDAAGGNQKKKKRRKRRNRPQGHSRPLDHAPPNFDPGQLAALSGPPLWQAVHEATVTDVTDAAVFVEVEAQGHEAVRAAVPAAELDGHEPIPGEELHVRLLDPPRGEEPVATASLRQARELEGLEALVRAANEGEPVPGVIVGEVKGGYAVGVGAGSEDELDRPGVLRAFLPRSQASHSRTPGGEVVGASDRFDVTELEPERANIVVSRKARLRAEAKKRAKELWQNIKEGDKVRGRVRALVAYGAFLDVDGVDGLLHVSDLSWEHRPQVAEVLKVGQELETVVLVADRSKKRLKLGLKQLQPDPWEEVRRKLAPGSEVEGDIVALADFGAFVRIDEGVEGLVHLSELSWERVKHPSQKLSIGQRVTAKVLDADLEKRRISLSMKALEPNPFAAIAEKYPEGAHAKATVRSLKEFGAFVELEDGVEGLVHIGELSWTERVGHPSEVLTIGQEIEVAVMSVDVGRQRVSCSLKRLEDNPWAKWEKKFSRGTRHKLTVSRISDRGAFFDLDDGLSAFCPRRELSSDPVSRVQDIVRVGDELELEVRTLDRRYRRVTLSAKAVVEGDTRKAYADYKKREKTTGHSDRTTLGDALKGQLADLQLNDAGAEDDD
jgi:small subunit ribosomal protein S1